MKKRLDLMPEGPLLRIDRALSLVRHGGLETLLLAFSAGAVPALAVLGAFWLERVEGVFELRLGIAAMLVLAFGVRGILAGAATRTYVRNLWDAVEIPPGAGRPLSMLRTSAVVSLGLTAWAILFLASTMLGPFAFAFLFPLLSIRGMLAPGWLARAACTEDSGVRAIVGALSDNSHQRGEGLTVEFLLSLATLGLTINLLATAAFALLLMRSFIGLELALLDQFLSMRNTFTLVGAGLFALVLLEPLRAALSAIVFVDARVKAEGLDVRAAIDAAVEHGGRRKHRSENARAALFLLAAGALAWPTALAAQPPIAEVPPQDAPAPDAPAPEPDEVDATGAALGTDPHATPEDLARDLETARRADRILAGPEYREFADSRGRGLRELIARWLSEIFDDPAEGTVSRSDGGFSLPLPGPGLFIVLGVILVLIVALYLFLGREKPLPPVEAGEPQAERPEDPRDRAPRAWVDLANQLAREGRFREALRALYLATLVALDRQRVITFDPTLTNWQYLRQIGSGSMRTDFRELTRIFDHKWYGQEDTQVVDYEVCRELAERMVARAERDGGAADPTAERGAA